MQEILNQLEDRDALGERRGENSKQQQRIQASKFDRRALHPEMEAKLYMEYKELRRKGLKVKGWWFRLRAKQILRPLQIAQLVPVYRPHAFQRETRSGY